MVLLGGMPRSGSTWQDDMVKKGLGLLGRRPSYDAYWDYRDHKEELKRKTYPPPPPGKLFPFRSENHPQHDPKMTP